MNTAGSESVCRDKGFPLPITLFGFIFELHGVPSVSFYDSLMENSALISPLG